MRLPGRAGFFSRLLLAAAVAVAVIFAADTPGFAETSSTNCSLFASPMGSDSASGSVEHPFASVQRLADALTAGQVGCVRGGTYSQEVRVNHGGSSGASVTITSYPGERATLIGRLYLPAGSNYVTIANMNLDGKNAASNPSPTINDSNATFVGDDVTTEHTEICFIIGSSWGRAKQTVIERDRIHDCGVLPSNNKEHGIYVARADNTRIVEDVIYKNTDRGIQLYPDAQGTVIEQNIIDANGEGIIFSGSSGVASNNTTVKDNLITNANVRSDVESWYPAGNPIGEGNIVENNCLWGGVDGTIQTPEIGFTAILNTTADPAYDNPAAGDYRVNATSPCAAFLQGTRIPTQPFNPTTETTTTASGTTTTPEPIPSGGGTETHQPAPHGHDHAGTATLAPSTATLDARTTRLPRPRSSAPRSGKRRGLSARRSSGKHRRLRHKTRLRARLGRK